MLGEMGMDGDAVAGGGARDASSALRCVLLIDTCAPGGGVALAVEGDVVSTVRLPGRTASAGLLEAVRAVLAESGRALADVTAVGVVSGPGSFTGVRVGLAAAKGFCEALGVPLAAVSRLEVLAEAGGMREGFAVLDAGRGEVYVRSLEAGGKESLWSVEVLLERSRGRRLVVAEDVLRERLTGADLMLRELSAGDACGSVLRRLAAGGDEPALVDANYVRGEAQIYAARADAAGPATHGIRTAEGPA